MDAMRKSASGSRGPDFPRQRWSEVRRRRIVGRSGGSVSVVALRHGMHAQSSTQRSAMIQRAVLRRDDSSESITTLYEGDLHAKRVHPFANTK